jgi:NAD(P)-dependent dehydrogenase (short-subunit alcohol dehydrogenase family)
MKHELSNIFSLQSKDVWVFGGAGHLGQPTILLLTQLGAKVLCVDLKERAQSFVNSVDLSKGLTAASVDVRDGEGVKRFVAENIKSRGVPHGLVNLTYAATTKKLEEISEKDFDEVNHGGLTSTFLLAREVGVEMAKLKRGSIVLFSSMYGSVSPDPKIYEAPLNKNPIEYGVTKAGILQMTRYLAVHWGRENVRCNCISPGPFPNHEVQKANPQFIQRLAEKSPVGRIGESWEIAGTVAFLLSDAASYITGQNLAVDGGWTAS